MAHIEDRWYREVPGEKPGEVIKVKKARHGVGKRYRVRYLDPNGAEKSESFDKKIQAEQFKIRVEADVLRGTYVDPDAGKITFRKHAEEVIENRTLDPLTRMEIRKRMGKHVYPVIGDKELGLLSKRPSIIQALVRNLEKDLAPTFVKVIIAHVSTVMAAAVDDELITKNPCKASSVTLPKIQRKKVVPWSAEYIFGMADALPKRYQAMVAVGAGLGLRQGEILGLSPDDIDWLRGIVYVRRQVKVLDRKLVFALPKGQKTREIPLPESVKVALSEHLREYPARSVTLPWRSLDGEPTAVNLMFTSPTGRAVHRDHLNIDAWHPALEKVGIVPKPAEGAKRLPAREHGMHAMRHFFASSLLTEGESVKAVSEWLGHHNAAYTLSVYVHLMPASEQRMRTLIDRALKRQDHPAHGPVTAPGGTE